MLYEYKIESLRSISISPSGYDSGSVNDINRTVADLNK